MPPILNVLAVHPEAHFAFRRLPALHLFVRPTAQRFGISGRDVLLRVVQIKVRSTFNRTGTMSNHLQQRVFPKIRAAGGIAPEQAKEFETRQISVRTYKVDPSKTGFVMVIFLLPIAHFQQLLTCQKYTSPHKKLS